MDEDDLMNHTNQTLDIETPSIITNNSREMKGALCGPQFMKFQEKMLSAFGLTSTVTCSIGILTNILIVLVLTRKHMSRSPTNAIVTSIALADLLFLISTLTFNAISYDVFHVDICVRHSYVMRMLLFISFGCSIVTSRASVMVTLLLAVWRYIAVTYPLKAQLWCNLRRTIVAIVACYAVVPISNVVIFSNESVGAVNTSMNSKWSDCVEVYLIMPTELVKVDNSLLNNAGHWLFVSLYKIVLPIVVVIISIVLIRALYLSSHRRSELTHNSTRLDRSCQRTTRTLLAVLIFFVVTELPFGIIVILSAVLDTTFDYDCYQKFFVVNDVLEILGGSLNFIFYVTMSKQFRTTFVSLLTADNFKRDQVATMTVEMT